MARLAVSTAPPGKYLKPDNTVEVIELLEVSSQIVVEIEFTRLVLSYVG